MTTPGELFIDRNHAGKIIGLAPTSGRKHDLAMVCEINDRCAGDVEANAARLAKAWNCHDELLAACLQVIHEDEHGEMSTAVEMCRAAITRATQKE